MMSVLIMFSAATSIMRVSIMNIAAFSSLSALKRFLFISLHDLIQ